MINLKERLYGPCHKIKMAVSGRVVQLVTCLATDASDCRSRGREFDAGLVPYFRRD